LRVSDSAILSYAQGDVLPIFIFDTDILSKLDKDDKRVTFIHQSVLNLKKELKSIGLDLAIFYAKPKEVFESLKDNFDEVLCSCDFDTYSIARDKEIESIIKIRRYYDSYLVEPSMIFNKSNQPYKVYTHFF
jgi:deoxyribodipyrimidine photo-lyase